MLGNGQSVIDSRRWAHFLIHAIIGVFVYMHEIFFFVVVVVVVGLFVCCCRSVFYFCEFVLYVSESVIHVGEGLFSLLVSLFLYVGVRLFSVQVCLLSMLYLFICTLVSFVFYFGRLCFSMLMRVYVVWCIKICPNWY